MLDVGPPVEYQGQVIGVGQAADLGGGEDSQQRLHREGEQEAAERTALPHPKLTPDRLGEAVTGSAAGGAPLGEPLLHRHYLLRQPRPLQHLPNEAVGHRTERVRKVNESHMGLCASLLRAVDRTLEHEVMLQHSVVRPEPLLGRGEEVRGFGPCGQSVGPHTRVQFGDGGAEGDGPPAAGTGRVAPLVQEDGLRLQPGGRDGP